MGIVAKLLVSAEPKFPGPRKPASAMARRTYCAGGSQVSLATAAAASVVCAFFAWRHAISREGPAKHIPRSIEISLDPNMTMPTYKIERSAAALA